MLSRTLMKAAAAAAAATASNNLVRSEERGVSSKQQSGKRQVINREAESMEHGACSRKRPQQTTNHAAASRNTHMAATATSPATPYTACNWWEAAGLLPALRSSILRFLIAPA